MKKGIVVLLLLAALPAAAWAQELSNAELYRMMKTLEHKFDQAMEQTSQALDEARKAKAEAAMAQEEAALAKAEVAEAKEETARVKAELAEVKAAAASAPAIAAVPAEPFIREAEMNPGMQASLEAIYMRPSRDNLDYVVEDADRVGPDRIGGNYRSLEPERELGARLGLSYNSETGTGFLMQYTMLDTSDSDAIERGTTNLWGTWLHANSLIDDDNVTRAEMDYDFDLDMFDLSAHKMFNVGSDLDLDIQAGLRYARVDQDIDITYFQDTSATTFRKVDIDSKNEFTGLGPRVGLDVDWHMGKGFNLFGGLAGSLLIGDFDLSRKDHEWPSGGGVGTRRVDIERTEHNRMVPVVEMRAGIGYAHELENGMRIGAMAGYEWQNWFNMVTDLRYVDDVDSQLASTDTTDLSLDGFFLEGFINF